MENSSVERQMVFEFGFEIKAYGDNPDEFYLLRNGRPYSPGDGFGWSRLSYAGAVRRVEMVIKRLKTYPPREDV